MSVLLYNNIQYSKNGFEGNIDRLRDYQQRGKLYKSLHPANKNIVDLTVLKSLIQKQIQDCKQEGPITGIDSISQRGSMLRVEDCYDR